MKASYERGDLIRAKLGINLMPPPPVEVQGKVGRVVEVHDSGEGARYLIRFEDGKQAELAGHLITKP